MNFPKFKMGTISSFVILQLVGCATAPPQLSPLEHYEAMNCGQLADEAKQLKLAQEHFTNANSTEVRAGAITAIALGLIGGASAAKGRMSEAEANSMMMQGIKDYDAGSQPRMAENSKKVQEFAQRAVLISKYNELRDCNRPMNRIARSEPEPSAPSKANVVPKPPSPSAPSVKYTGPASSQSDQTATSSNWLTRDEIVSFLRSDFQFATTYVGAKLVFMFKSGGVVQFSGDRGQKTQGSWKVESDKPEICWVVPWRTSRPEKMCSKVFRGTNRLFLYSEGTQELVTLARP